MTTTNVAISNIVTATKTPSTIFTDSIPVCIIHGSPRRPQSCVSHELEVLLSENKSYKYFDLIPTLVTYAHTAVCKSVSAIHLFNYFDEVQIFTFLPNKDGTL